MSYIIEKIKRILFLPDIFRYKGDIEKIIFNENAEESRWDSIYARRWRENYYAYFPRFWRRHFHIKTIVELKCLKGRVLDFGCGTGHLDVELAKKGYHICGIDISPTAISVANYYRNRQKQSILNCLEFINTDVKTFVPKERFDSCLITDVLEHLPLKTAKVIISEFHRILDKNAEIFISVPFANYYFDNDHCNFYYSLEEFNTFCKNIGLTVMFSQIDPKWHVINSITLLERESDRRARANFEKNEK